MSDEQIRLAASEFGRRGGKVKSEAKKAAGQRNTAKAREAKAQNGKPLAPCNCRAASRPDGSHRTYCPVYKRERRTEDRAAHGG